MARVRLKNVEKKYGEVVAVKDFNLDIEDKQFCVLVGPSGCGKTTTLRLVAGLEELTSGEIYIGERKVNNVPPKDRDIAMVFQNYALYPHMSVYDNMGFGLKLRGYSKREIDTRVREAAEILNIAHLLERKPKELSGGQRQRVAVGRAIVRKPKVFLFDEPLSNLDAKLRVQMRTELKKLHSRLQTTIIYVTHDQTEAMTMGDRICVMKDGLIQQVDDPLKLYDNPQNKFVAGFIGSPPMNFVPVEVIKEGDALYLDEGSFKVKLPDKMKSAVEPYLNQKLTLGIRPEDIYDKLFYHLGPLSGNVVTVTVDVVEPMGSELYVHLNTGKNTLTARVDPHTQVKPNQLIEVVFNMEKIHLFSPETEQAIV
ncbi:MAG: sn-glycerol-3-phosphate ABC transporter ATP-binding protein UgpC [Elusimicrobiota bacterium]|nr:sn-glycerol-3-phosphate ABC transporter ATP-binding protein UgpC [Elusimicrobiota bacterium]